MLALNGTRIYPDFYRPFAPQMTKSKLEKFQELEELPNVYQNCTYLQPQLLASGKRPVEMRGRWNKDHFPSAQPITLELACGRGEYTVGLARRYPHRNFIGVDIKGNRIWSGATQAVEEGLSNTAFLRTDITILDQFVGAGEVAEIWITFPDPYLREGKAGKRLTSNRFLNLYRKVGVPGLPVHLKTDSAELYEFSVDSVSSFGAQIECSVEDIDAGTLPVEELEIPTYYERMHRDLGKTIKYLRFRL